MGAFAVVEVLDIPSGAEIDSLEIIEPIPGTADAWQTRETPLMARDTLVVGVGGRYAKRSISGYAPEQPSPPGQLLDLLNTGGVSGIRDNPEQLAIKLKILGAVEHQGTRALLSDFPAIPSAVAPMEGDDVPETPVVLVMGSDMEVGKTTCAASLASSLRAAGIKVTYVKLTGTGRMRDLMRVCYGRPLGYFDSSRLGWDFVDAGLATTYGIDSNEVSQRARILLRHAVVHGEIVLAEIADAPDAEGSIQVTTDPWIQAWVNQSGLILCACDSVESSSTVDWIRGNFELGNEEILISGRMADNPSMKQEIEANTGLKTISCISPSGHSPHAFQTAGGALADWVIRHVMTRRRGIE